MDGWMDEWRERISQLCLCGSMAQLSHSEWGVLASAVFINDDNDDKASKSSGAQAP